VLPAITNVTPAFATPSTGFPGTTAPWVTLDVAAAARLGYDIYKGKYSPAQTG
jgi:hypothetical protein